MIRTRERRVAPREAVDEPRVLRVGPREHLGRVGDVADQVGHRALGLGHRAPPARRSPSPRRARRGSARRPAGRRRSRRARASIAVDELVERARARSGSARSAASTATPSSTASRSVAGVAPVGEAPRGRVGARGGASATNVPPPRPRTACRWPVCTSAVSAWRSVERAIPSCSHSSRSAGSRVPGAQQAELDRGAEPLQRLLERRRATGPARRRRVSAAITAARTPGLAPSR